MFQSNKVNLIIAIIAAIAIWAYVVSEVNPVVTDTIREVRVELTNLESLAEDGLTVAPNQSFSVDVIVKGTSSAVRNLADDRDAIEASANMTGHPRGEGLVQVHIDRLPDGIELVETRPSELNVFVEDLLTVNKPVKLMYNGTMPEKQEPGFITISPQEVEVSGTRKLVDSIAFVSAMINVDDLSDQESSIKTELIPMQDDEDPVYNVKLSQDTVDVTATLLNVKEVPLVIDVEGEPKGNSAVTNIERPRTVSIRGSAKAIADIDQVTANNININGLDQTMIFIPDVQLPEGVQLASASQNINVTVEISGVIAASVTFSAGQIEIVGLPTGYTAHVNTGSINVNVFGTREIIEQMEEKELTPYVDLNGVNLAESSAELKVMFRNADDFTRVESIPDLVRVNIKRNANIEAETVSNSASLR